MASINLAVSTRTIVSSFLIAFLVAAVTRAPGGAPGAAPASPWIAEHSRSPDQDIPASQTIKPEELAKELTGKTKLRVLTKMGF